MASGCILTVLGRVGMAGAAHGAIGTAATTGGFSAFLVLDQAIDDKADDGRKTDQDKDPEDVFCQPLHTIASFFLFLAYGVFWLACVPLLPYMRRRRKARDFWGVGSSARHPCAKTVPCT